MVRYLLGTCFKSTTVTHVLTSSRRIQMSRRLVNSDPKDYDDRAPSSSSVGTTGILAGSGVKAVEGNGQNGANLSLEERLEKWKTGVNPDVLSGNARLIHNSHLKAVEESRETYRDPVTGYDVITMLAHLKRGSCCGNACRHCPYSHVNVPLSAQRHFYYNSAFYS